MVRSIVQTLLAVVLLTAPVLAQNTNPQRMWYRGAFDGWVETRSTPQQGYYYQPSPDPAYPLNEASYGQPLYCNACHHAHFPGKDVCPYCGQRCPAGGNDLNPNTVYTQRRLPGSYYYEEQPHYRFASPLRLNGSYRKYDRPWN